MFLDSTLPKGISFKAPAIELDGKIYLFIEDLMFREQFMINKKIRERRVGKSAYTFLNQIGL